jgi:hypothetical protein
MQTRILKIGAVVLGLALLLMGTPWGVAAQQTIRNITVSASALPTGAATSAKQDTGNTSLSTLAGAVASSRVNINLEKIGGNDPVTSHCEDPSKRLSVTLATGSSGLTQLVALTSSQVIYVCDYDIVTTDDNTVQLEYGTGSACGTGTTALAYYPFLAVANLGVARSGGSSHLFKTPASNALCINLGSAESTAVNLTYVKE